MESQTFSQTFWKPNATQRLLFMLISVIAGTYAQSSPSTSDEPTANESFVIVAVVLVATIVTAFVIIILLYCCRRYGSNATERPFRRKSKTSKPPLPLPRHAIPSASTVNNERLYDMTREPPLPGPRRRISSATTLDDDLLYDVTREPRKRPPSDSYEIYGEESPLSHTRAIPTASTVDDDSIYDITREPRERPPSDSYQIYSEELRKESTHFCVSLSDNYGIDVDEEPPLPGPRRRISSATTLDDDLLYDITRARMELPYAVKTVDMKNTEQSAFLSRSPAEEEADVSFCLYKEQYFDRHGGVLLIPEADISLTIPPGAITHGHIISVNVVPSNLVSLPGRGLLTRLTPFVICEPDGLQFLKPVELILPHCGVIDDTRNHSVNVHFGRKKRYFSRDMTWEKEDVKYVLTRRFCHIYLNHFSGVNVTISGTTEKILRAIPFASAIDDDEPNEDIILNMWLCNDLAADYLTLVRTEVESKNIPLDSYDTFRLDTSEHQPTTYVEVTAVSVDGTNRVPEINTKKVDTHGLATTDKSKCTFRFTNNGEQHDHNYFYVKIKINQETIGNEKRETLFVLRKKISDLTIHSECLREENPFVATNNSLSESGKPPSEDPPKSFIVVPFVDPMINDRDDFLITLWLLSQDSAKYMLSNFEKEQKILQKVKLDTENSLTIRNKRKPVTSTICFRKGNWKPISDKIELELGKLLYGDRAKFPFICRKDGYDTARVIDVEITVAQEGDTSQTEFMKRKRVEDFFVGSVKREPDTSTKASPDSRRFEDLCKSLTDSLSEVDCHCVATYFDFRPAQIEEVLTSDRPAETLIRKLRQKLLFTKERLGWVQTAMASIDRNDLAEIVCRRKMEIQGFKTHL